MRKNGLSGEGGSGPERGYKSRLSGYIQAMKKGTVIYAFIRVLSGFALLAALSGCSRHWDYPDAKSLETGLKPLDPEVCQTCHKDEYDTWKKTAHSVQRRMDRIPSASLRNCNVCHDVLPEHSTSPTEANTSNPVKLTKTAQNQLCGRCHYNQELFGSQAINPRDRHGMFMDVGLEGRKKQVSCLDCHEPHHGKSAMLGSIKAHACFKCHKAAIVTMGIFQPFNYLSFGKMCQACHTIHGGSTAAKNTRMGVGFCIICHFSTAYL